MRRFCAGAVALLVVAWSSAVAPQRLSAAPLYEGSSNQLPNSPTWNWGYLPLNLDFPIIVPAVATATAAGGVTTLDTTPATADAAGYTTFIPVPFAYADPDVVPLDRNAGFQIQFGLHVVSESHVSNDRAGFSIIALDIDAIGLELAFWQDQIWAQNVGFTHGESSATFDTTASMVDYRLEFLGSSYKLFANNVQLLTGALRDYTGPVVYDHPNYTFFGDDTSSAAAKVEISYFNVVPVPEPSALVLAGLAAGLLAVCRAKRF